MSRIDDTYEKFRSKFVKEFDLPSAVLGAHPSEQENAALAVVRRIVPFESGNSATRLAHAVETYGVTAKLRLGNKVIELLPIAHPAAPKAYQLAHKRWCEAKTGSSRTRG